MRYYHFRQNNSGGNFLIKKDKGITIHVIVAAKTEEEANARAEEIGIYFDGCDNGRDCHCCGDRWYPGDEDDGETFPHIYGTKIKDYLKKETYMWAEEGRNVAVHFANGRVKWY